MLPEPFNLLRSVDSSVCVCMCVDSREGRGSSRFQSKKHICVPIYRGYESQYFYALSHFSLLIDLSLKFEGKWVKKVKIIKEKTAYL